MTSVLRTIKNVYASSNSFRKALKIFTDSSLYLTLTKFWISKQIISDKKGPFNLLLETTSICNAQCLMCPHRIMKRQQKVMSEEIFNKIISRIKEEKLPLYKVYVNGFGEPLTDKYFLERLKVLKSLGLYLSFYTNASLLTEKIAQAFIDIGVDEVNISFNGVSKKQYEKIMKLDFNRSILNIENLIALKRKVNASQPKIRISSIIVAENEADIKKHLKNWEGKADAVTVSQAHDWGGAVTVKSKYGFSERKHVFPCRSLWHTLALDAEGNFIICCRDYESKVVLGNIMKHSFKDIFQSPILASFRNKHLMYKDKNLPEMCRKCNFPYQDGCEWLVPRKFS